MNGCYHGLSCWRHATRNRRRPRLPRLRQDTARCPDDARKPAAAVCHARPDDGLPAQAFPPRQPHPDAGLAALLAQVLLQDLQGFLLSGGSNRHNEIKYERYYPVIEKLKSDFPHLRIAVHSALLDEQRAKSMASAGVDTAMMDVIGADQTIRQVYHLDRPVEDFEATLAALCATGMEVVPHIVIGLHYGRILGELEALEIVGRHPFPGPGLAIRIIGPVTKRALEILRQSDAIFIDEIKRAGLYDDIWQALAVLLPVRSVGVMGDARTYDNVIALRAVTSQDGMTADWYPFQPDVLGRIANRIINEVDGVNRVVYDASSKPPATIEWE